MTEPGIPDKRSRIARRYLLDRSSQIPVVLYIVGTVAGIGLLYAFAVFVLLGSEAMADKSIAENRYLMLTVHAAYSIVGGAILFVLVLLLTHRFTGPAFVMRRAIKCMRKGDYSERLKLRPRDYHKELAQQLALLQKELAVREHAQAELLRDIAQALEEGDLERARYALSGQATPAPTPVVPSSSHR